MSEVVNLEVNGVAVQARKGEMIIRCTDAHGVYVPRFCYHEKLPVAANCRMCLVEVEKAPKPLPACATPVAEGMKVYTKSPKAIAAQKAVMEFLLINHPLDCPICDQGGECELQDLAVGYGRDISRYAEGKRVVKDKSLGPLVSTDMTRCIHCTRCVRFGQEVAGIQELGTTGRGEQMQIGTFIEKSVDHELSGNIIDLCPVGALNSKPFRYHARAWEMTQQPMISPHDGFGTNTYGHVLRGKLMRVVPRPAEELNETWIADRDRFSYEGIYSDDRLRSPMLRQADGTWKEVGWDAALTVAAEGFKRVAAEQIGILAHPSSTLEELYLLRRLANGLGTPHIDHRLRQRDFSDQAEDRRAPGLGLSIKDIEQLESLLIVGSDLRQELPMLAHRVRKAAQAGAKIALLNPARYDYLFPLASYLDTGGAPLAHELASVLKALVGKGARKNYSDLPPDLAARVDALQPNAGQRSLAAALQQGERRALWLGALALRDRHYGELRQLARAIAKISGAQLGELAEGGNGAGAYLAGAVPHRDAAGANSANLGRSAAELLSGGMSAYLLHGLEPRADSGIDAAPALRSAQHVVALCTHLSPELQSVAHVLLPIGSFAETSGTYVNLEGRWQSVAGVASPVGAARPGWKVLRTIATLLAVPGADYQSSEQLRDELRAACERASEPTFELPSANAAPPQAANGAPADSSIALYGCDAIVRRAESLQLTRAARAER